MLDAVFEKLDEFVCESHCAVPYRALCQTDIGVRISELSGMEFSETFELDSVTTAVKWHTKYARQNGAHSTPTFAVNGLINDAMSSGQSIEEWADLLGLNANR